MTDTSFIKIYDNALSTNSCTSLINIFESNNVKKVPGVVIDKGKPIIKPKEKKSLEISNCFFNSKDKNIQSIVNIFKTSLLKNVSAYVEEYSFLKSMNKFTFNDGFTFKKFKSKKDGYKVWHMEQTVQSRIIVWAFYLNDAEGTEFKYFPTVEAIEGRLVVFPAGWTHAHRGAFNKKVKYIITGWLVTL